LILKESIKYQYPHESQNQQQHLIMAASILTAAKEIVTHYQDCIFAKWNNKDSTNVLHEDLHSFHFSSDIV
jgi:sulfur relay (sulfurtransferase) DsrF/TusC family protein